MYTKKYTYGYICKKKYDSGCIYQVLYLWIYVKKNVPIDKFARRITPTNMCKKICTYENICQVMYLWIYVKRNVPLGIFARRNMCEKICTYGYVWSRGEGGT